MTCTHLHAHAKVEVVRYGGFEPGEMPHSYIARITLKCADCGIPFRFLGLPKGVYVSGPGCNPDDTEVFLATEPVPLRGAS